MSTTPGYNPPPPVGAPVTNVGQVFSLMKLGHALHQEPPQEGAAASSTPRYHIRIGAMRRPVTSSAALSAINSGRIGHGMDDKAGGFFWKQTTRTP